MLILDEPTNHLDVDAREALVQALNEYEGAVVIVSHDRHMLELTADRLVLVDGGAATEFKGSLDDYTAFVLSQGKAEKAGGGDKPAKINRKDERSEENTYELQSLMRISTAVFCCQKKNKAKTHI